MKPPYTVRIFAPQELNHSSYLQTGLFELEQSGYLKTNVVLSLKKRLGSLSLKNQVMERDNNPHPKTSFYELSVANHPVKITFATDLYDAAYSFSEYALKHCDFVFKRNYDSKYIAQLPENYRKKIHPLGWCFGVHSDHKKGKYKFLISLLLSNLAMNVKFDRRFYKRIFKTYKNQLAHWEFINTTRKLKSFDEPPAKASQDFIVFQTRCFAHENSAKLKQLHQQRYRIIHLLRTHFPKLFKGGFIPSKVVIKNYKDAVTNLKTDPKSYLELVKAAKIGIYTQGIQDSPAWKMAEYLSQGKVIIAQKFNTLLPIPLEHGKHVLFFDKEEEIPELCKSALNDPALAETLSYNGRKYYEVHIAPKQNIKRIIELMLDHTKQ